ncbi:MAG: hypothetical protein IJ663_06420 [Spirochaetales bacterium]|nr:hypothetical protein [Spirochaetales bacterium]
MKYEMAQKGIGKIYKAEILSIIAVIFSIVSLVLMTVLGKAIQSDGKQANISDVISGIVLIVSAVIAFVSFFLNLFGILNASKDESSFRDAMIALCVGIASSFLQSLFKNNELLTDLFQTVYRITEMLVSYFVVTGCINLAKQIGNSKVEEAAKSSRNLILVVWMVSIATNIIGEFILKKAGETVVAIVGIIALLLSIISYFVYLRALKKTLEIL